MTYSENSITMFAVLNLGWFIIYLGNRLLVTPGVGLYIDWSKNSFSVE